MLYDLTSTDNTLRHQNLCRRTEHDLHCYIEKLGFPACPVTGTTWVRRGSHVISGTPWERISKGLLHSKLHFATHATYRYTYDCMRLLAHQFVSDQGSGWFAQSGGHFKCLG